MQVRDLMPWGRTRGLGTPGRDLREGTPDHALAALQRDMNALFDGLWGHFDVPAFPFSMGFAGEWPRCDVVDNDTFVEVTVELPGLDEKDIQLTLEGTRLTIRGEKKAETERKREGYVMSERSFGSVRRMIDLPFGVQAETATAAFKNGVLTVHFPKAEEAREHVKKIPLKAD